MQNINDDLIVDNYLKSYLEYIGNFPILSKDEINTLFKNKDYETIYNHNLKLVPFIAKKFIKNKGEFSFMDLIQEGNIGLMDAIKKYDYTLNNAFSTYAAFWIRQKITLAIARNSRIINLSYNMHYDYNKYQKCLNKLTITLGRNPTLEELACELNISISKLKDIINSEKTVSSLDTSEDWKEYNKESYELDEDNILDIMLANKIIKYAKISKKDFDILTDYYYYEIPVKTISLKYNCTRQNIEASLKSSLKKITIAKEEINNPEITKLSELNIYELYRFLMTRSIRQIVNYFKKFSSDLIFELFNYAELNAEEIMILNKLLGINELIIYTPNDLEKMYNYDKDILNTKIKTSFHKLASLIKLLYPQETKTRTKKINHN